MVVLKFQTDLAKAPYANDEPLTCSERAWRAPPSPSRSFEDDRRKGPLREKHEGAPGAVIGGQGRT